MSLVFVLYQPETGFDVGATARVIKNMDTSSQLRVVQPPEGDEHARWMTIWAHSSGDVLDGRQDFTSLAAAVADCDAVIGLLTTQATSQKPVVPIRQGMTRWISSGKTAFVAARDMSVLTPALDCVVQEYALITTAQRGVATLQWAQAALLVGYESILLRGGRGLPGAGPPPTESKYKELHRAYPALCRRIMSHEDAERIAPLLVAPVLRAEPSDTDINIVLGIATQVRRHLRPESD